MTNKQRRSIVDDAKSKGYTGSYIDLFRQAALNPSDNQEVLTAGTPLEKEQGLRPHHEAGRTDASMAFTDVPPNTPFNTVGMKAPIDIKKYDEQGHLVKSYESVPPGIQNLNTGPARGTVLETPSRMQKGGFNPNEYMNEMQPKVFPNQKRDAEWVNYATTHDFAGRFPGETRTNEQIGLERSNKNTTSLVPNPVRPKQLKRAQEGATVEPEEEQSWGDYLGFNNPMNVTNFVNPFSQLFAPKLAVDELKTRITDNIQPHGYDKGDKNPLQRMYSAVVEDESEKYSNKDMQDRGKGRSAAFEERTDLFKMMLGQNQVHNSIKESEYKPTKGDPNDTYYSSKATEKFIRDNINNGTLNDILGVGYHSNYGEINVLGNYTIDQGEDEKGKYISYYDRWDLNPISNGKKGPAYYAEEAAKAVLGLQGPEVYGRVYYNRGGYRRAQGGGFKSLTDRRKKASDI